MTEKKKIIIASLWVLGIFGLSQLLRLGSNLVVTRLLEPEMFGIMAIVYVVIQGLAMFSDLGLWAFIVRHKNGTDINMLDTIWTVQVVRGWFMFIAIVFIALSFMAINQYTAIDLGRVYSNTDLPLLLMVAGVTAVISGYNSLAPAMVSRDLKRGRIELIELTSQIVATGVMIFLAWKYHSIWALVSAAVVASLMKVMLTYRFFNVRHQFAWDKKIVSEVYAFGKWIFFASILTYLGQQGDRLIFASYISVAQLGVYSIAFMLSGVVTNILTKMIEQIWFPSLSKVVNERPKELKRIYYNIRLKQDLVVFFCIGIMIAISPKMIEFLYDKRFHEAGWMMQVLSFSLIGLTLSKVGLECLSALGITKIRMKVMLIRSLSIFIGLPVLFHYYGLLGAIWGVVISNYISIPIQYLEMKKQNIFSLILEVRMVPIVVVGYLSCQLVINENYISFLLAHFVSN